MVRSPEEHRRRGIDARAETLLLGIARNGAGFTAETPHGSIAADLVVAGGGGQIVGGPGAGKRIEVVATAATLGLTPQQLADLDLAYAPPFSPVWDPVQTAARSLLSGTRAANTHRAELSPRPAQLVSPAREIRKWGQAPAA